MNLVEHVTADLERRAIRRVARAASALLQLDPGFSAAFPVERSRGARGSALDLERAVREAARDPVVRRLLPASLAGDLEGLLEPGQPASLRRPVRALACELAATASALSGGSALSDVLAGQVCWLDGDTVEADRAFARALAGARDRRGAALALVHRAILIADEGRCREALSLLLRAAALDPGRLASHWTIAVYAAALGQLPLAQHHLRRALRCGGVSAVRARALSAERHLLALADRGIGARSTAPALAHRFVRAAADSIRPGAHA